MCESFARLAFLNNGSSGRWCIPSVAMMVLAHLGQYSIAVLTDVVPGNMYGPHLRVKDKSSHLWK